MNNTAIRLLILDVDGVLTDGKFYLTADGQEQKCFHAQDGLGIKQCMRAGIDVAIISGRNSDAVTRRMQELGVKYVYQGIKDKAKILNQLLTELSISAEQVASVGDDLPDLAIMDKIGLPIAVNNAVNAVKDSARWVSQRSGGEGAVREICDWILSNQHAN